MRRNLLLILALSTMFCTQAGASVTVEQTTDPEYIINSGFSEVLAEEVKIAKSRADGQPSEPLNDKKYNKFVRFLRNAYAYLDPSWDSEERIHHDVHMSPSWHDL